MHSFFVFLICCCAQMIRQSGVRTYAEVVEFCRATGIPLSRMLRLDLMRQLQTNNTTTNNNNSGR